MNKPKLTEDPVTVCLRRMTIPMIFAIVSMMLFNIIDTYWVAQLGDDALAAISFTFPAAYSTITLAIGLGVGAAAVLAKAIGEGNPERVERLMGQAFALGTLVAIGVASVGLLTHDALFTAMGAEQRLIPIIYEYMQLWYLGLPILMLPIICNAALRATGDAKTPARVMGSAALLNLILDPILIFGYFGMPAMGVRGAAVATLISWALSLVLAVRVMAREGHLSNWSWDVPELTRTWGKMLYIGIPAAFAQMLTPLSAGFVTRLVAPYGAEYVAGYGVGGGRVEPIALVVVIALTTALGPFVGQNWGAKLYDRVRLSLRKSLQFAIVFELLLLPFLLLVAAPIARAFSGNSVTIETIVSYLWIAPFTYGFVGVSLVISAAYNALHKPMIATLINVLRLFGFLIPFAIVGGAWYGLSGVFIGAACANIASGVVAYLFMSSTLRRIEA